MSAQFLTGLDLNSPSWDLFIFLFFIIAAFVYGFTLGRSRIIVLIVSTYMALALVKTAPFLLPQSITIGSSPFFIVQITLFLASLLLIFFFLSNSALRRGLSVGDIQGRAWQVILFSFLQAGLLVALVLSFIPPVDREGLLTVTRGLFISDWAVFLWVLAPIVLMMFIRDPEEDS